MILIYKNKDEHKLKNVKLTPDLSCASELSRTANYLADLEAQS